MVPFFFGSSSRRLFGIYSMAQANAVAATSRAAVLCYPWGPEYQYSHRSMRHLAVALAQAGVHVLRFDYLGTGDSDGNARDFGLTDWMKDIESAIEELKDTAGVSRVSLIGLRLGALLAAQVAAAGQSTVDRLVLWDPVVSGPRYLEEIEQVADLEGAPSTPNDGHSVQGFPFAAALSSEIRSADLVQTMAGYSGLTVVVASATATLDPRLRTLQSSRPPESFIIDEVDSPPVWHPQRGLGVGAIPVELVTRIVDRLSQ
jgi:pimeloyl-ACP methyl ester carboxylesterase